MESKVSNQQEPVDPGVRLVRSVTGVSWLLTIVLSGGSLFMFGQLFALSVVLGGVLINISFLLLQKDLRQLFTKISRAGDHAAAVSRTEKIRFYVKFYARLIILGLLLIALVSNMALNMIGLTLGLTTVMFSVIVVVLSRGKTFYSEQSLRSV